MKCCRCDQNYDCKDGSDETNCKIVQIDESRYLKDKPPPVLEKNDLVFVTLEVEITKILLIDEARGFISYTYQINHRMFSLV